MTRTLALFVALVTITAAAAAFVSQTTPHRLRHLPIPVGSALPVIPGPKVQPGADSRNALQAFADVLGRE